MLFDFTRTPFPNKVDVQVHLKSKVCIRDQKNGVTWKPTINMFEINQHLVNLRCNKKDFGNAWGGEDRKLTIQFNYENETSPIIPCFFIIMDMHVIHEVLFRYSTPSEMFFNTDPSCNWTDPSCNWHAALNHYNAFMALSQTIKVFMQDLYNQSVKRRLEEIEQEAFEKLSFESKLNLLRDLENGNVGLQDEGKLSTKK